MVVFLTDGAPTVGETNVERILEIVELENHRWARLFVFGVGDEAGFDEARFVITDAYTGGSDALKKTFEEAPKHRDAKYADFCARELDYDRGDDVLQIGRIDLAAARSYLLEQVPHRSLPGLLAATVILTLQRLVLPVLHWLDDSRSFGILRPRHGEADRI